MAEITASMVKELRERTGAGMMDCKNALVEAGGDPAKAAEIIQKKGQAKAVKAAGKIAADGAIVAELTKDGTRGVLVEVNSQTDFVARGEDFQSWSKHVAEKAMEPGIDDVAALEAAHVHGKTLREHAEHLTAKSGEKHAIRRMAKYEVAAGKGLITTYIHHGARLGVLLEVTTDKGGSPEVRAFADDIALQIASMGPRFVRKDEVPADVKSKQTEIFAAQLKNEDDETVAAFEEFKRRMDEEGGEHSDKVKEHLKGLEKKANTVKARPDAARQKIVEGKLAKWLMDIVLLDQNSVKESNKTIAQLVSEFSAKNGKLEIARFARFELGEGVDRGATKDFATEVAEMAAAAQKNG